MATSLSLSVTAYNESLRGNFHWIRECVGPASLSPLVREIVVVNDGTPDYDGLCAELSDVPKVHLFNNPARFHVFGNKLESVYCATSEWVLLCDSDNVMASDYYKKLESLWPWLESTWYCASYARPSFDYRPFIGTWRLGDIRMLAQQKAFWCFVNTGNQLIHRATFLKIFEHLRGKRFDLEQPDYFGVGDRRDEKWFLAYGAQDSFYLLKEWLLHNHAVQCVRGLEYDHRVGTGNLSNYNRGPVEKEALAPAYLLELLDRAEGQNHTFTYIEHRRGGFGFRRSDGKEFQVNLAGGSVREEK